MSAVVVLMKSKNAHVVKAKMPSQIHRICYGNWLGCQSEFHHMNFPRIISSDKRRWTQLVHELSTRTIIINISSNGISNSSARHTSCRCAGESFFLSFFLFCSLQKEQIFVSLKNFIISYTVYIMFFFLSPFYFFRH